MEQAQAKSHIPEEQLTEMQAVYDLCAVDMGAVNTLIRNNLDSDVVLIRQIAEYIIGSGGKRLRPMLVILASHACGFRPDTATGNHQVTLAAIIEFIHTATLLHDDVVDESELRRGKETAHAVWGNAASVLVGDFLYSRAFQMMTGINSMRVMDVLSNATNLIAEGEVEQLLNMYEPELSESRYFSVIEKKTAKLFEAACQLGAVLAGRPDLEHAMAVFGRELGTAFQVTDDVLDYTSSTLTLGKNTGDDLAEGKTTLPLILCRSLLEAEKRELVDESIRQGNSSSLVQIIELIRESGALEASVQIATEHAQAALSALDYVPGSEWKSAMSTLARYSVSRQH